MSGTETVAVDDQSPFALTSRVWKTKPWYRKNIMKWALYDLGNTIYSMVVVSLTIGPLLYIKYYDQGLSGEEAVSKGNNTLAIALMVGNLVMAFLSPYLGAVADQRKERKRLLMKLTWLCVTFMALLGISYWVDDILLLVIIFLIANIFYQTGLIVYDSMLPFVADKEDIGKVAGFGIAIGYFGSIIGVGLGYVLIAFGLPDYVVRPAKEVGGVLQPDEFNIGYIPFIYPLAALVFLLFALPMYTLKEKELDGRHEDLESTISETTQKIIDTGKEIMKYRSMKWFIFGWLIYVDAANTVIFFMGQIVTVGLEFGEGQFALIVLAIGIISAVILTYPVGSFADKHGPRKTLMLTTFLWIVSILLAFMTNINSDTAKELGFGPTPDWLLYVFPILVGPALGGTWVVQRQFLTELAPPDKVGNYFGFANIFGRISAAFGPIVFTTVVDILWKNIGFSINVSMRLGTFLLGGLLLIGFLLLLQVYDPHDHYLKGAKANGKGQWIKGNTVLYDENLKSAPPMLDTE
ncbi:MAG: MFS transporter [Methanobacteriota archaeon]|nr:MAG: MFS transporter [Euryarchaeota archaeon]